MFETSSAFLFFIPLVLIVLWRLIRKNNTAAVIHTQITLLKKVNPSLKSRLAKLPWILRCLGVVFCILALARPQKVDSRTKKNVEGIDIIICLDVSDSMLIEDMPPSENRLESAKRTIKEFIEKRSSDRIGVVVFAGESFTLVPLTLDYQVILKRVSEITTARQARIKDGTALGVAMANAAGRLKDSTAKSRVMIFMTDGENNSGTIDPLTGLEIAKGYGVKVYSIGIGNDGPTRLPVYQRDVFGNIRKNYQPFESYVNDELLQKMADETGGKYFRAGKGDALASVFSEIDRLEKTKVDVSQFTRYEELYRQFLWIGCVLLMISWLMETFFYRRVAA